MARVSNFLSWFFFCLAAVLVTLAMLAVPENAFGDAGTFCTTFCNGNPDPNCYAACVDGYGQCADCTMANYPNPADLGACIAGCQNGGNEGPFCSLACSCSALSACGKGNACLVICKCQSDPTYGYVCD